jgi:DNA invertase Pin-like site-specific DNA recombinase
MGAANPRQRKITAREGAIKFGVSTRTIQRFMAEPREDYERRAREKRQRVRQLRAEGKKYKEIAEIMEISMGTVAWLMNQIRKEDEKAAAHQDQSVSST